VVVPPAEIHLGSLKISLDHKAGIVWALGSKQPEDLGISTLMNGRVSGNFFQETLVRSMSNMEYMIKQEDGRFELTSLTPEEGLGVTLAFTAEPPLNETDLRFNYRMMFARSRGRETLQDVSLPVGKPILDTGTIEAKITIELDVWVLVTALFVEDAKATSGDVLLVFLRPHVDE